jgi:hypothetical protein
VLGSIEIESAWRNSLTVNGRLARNVHFKTLMAWLDCPGFWFLVLHPVDGTFKCHFKCNGHGGKRITPLRDRCLVQYGLDLKSWE